MAEGRAKPRGENFSALNSQLSQAVGNFTLLLSSASAFGRAVNSFRLLEQQLAMTNAAAGGTVTTFNQMESAARNFALTLTASAQEAASAMYFLAQAGYDVQASVNAMTGVMVLSQATMQDVAFTSDLIASTLKTYQLASIDATRVANLFAAAQTNSLASLDKLAFSLRQVGPVAASMNQEIETTTAFLAELYNVGLRGEQAGTALRNVMVRMIDPPKEAREVLEKYNIAVRDSTGQIRQMEDVLRDLYKVGISEAEASALFGVEALAGGLTLIERVGTGAFDDQLDAITGTGKAYELAAAQLETLDGALKLARNSVDDLFISLGKDLAPAVVYVAETVQDLTKWFNGLSDSTRGLITTVGSSIGILMAMGTAWRAVVFAMGPVAGLAGRVFGTFGAGADDAVKKTSLLRTAINGVGTALAWSFGGGLTGSITALGTRITGVTTQATTLRQVFTTMNGVRFIPLIAGLGAVSTAIVGAGGLIYAIYRIGAAWREQTRIAREEVERQKAYIYEAANINPNEVTNIQGRIRRRETQRDMAGALGPLDQVSLYEDAAENARKDVERLNELRRVVEESNGAIQLLSDTVEDGNAITKNFLSISRQGPGRGNDGGAALANTGLREFAIQAYSTAQDIGRHIEDLYAGDALETLRNNLTTYESEIARLTGHMEATENTNSEQYEKWAESLRENQKKRAATVAQIQRMVESGGAENDPAVRVVQSIISNADALWDAIDEAMADGVMSRQESSGIRDIQTTLMESMRALAEDSLLSVTAVQEIFGPILETLSDAEVQANDFAEMRDYAVGEVVKAIAGGDLAGLSEILRGNENITNEVTALFKNATPAMVATFGQALIESGNDLQKALFDVIGQIDAGELGEGREVSADLKRFIDNITKEPVRAMVAEFTRSTNEAILETAQMRNDMRLAQAEIDENLAAGVEAVKFDEVLKAIEAFQDHTEDLSDDINSAFADAWNTLDHDLKQSIIDKTGIDASVADSLSSIMDVDSIYDKAIEMARDGKGADAIMAEVARATAQMEATTRAVTQAIIDQAIADGTMDAAAAAILNKQVEDRLELLSAAAEYRVAEIANAGRKAGKSRRFRGGGGKSAAEEALKLRKTFEKELRSIQRELLDAERDILEFDGTIDLTARFTGLIELDRREIAQKYDQQIQEIQYDIAAANEKFAKQPVYLGQLITGYNELIDQLERAKQAELEYTNTFTYQTKVRNDAIDRQIDAIRNMSMEGEKAGVAILQGVQAGMLAYQKDMRTTVDNVAQATVGVLDGLSEAVGAFITGSGDAMEILRNAVLNSLNELIVNATKRMLQTVLEGITGGAITNGVTGDKQKAVDPVQSSLAMAANQTQVVYSNHLTQMQGILSSFATGLNTALQGAVNTVKGAAGGASGALGSALPTPVRGAATAMTNAGKIVYEAGASLGNSVITSLKDGILATAQELEINPVDLAKVISFETAGTFDPRKAGPTTKWGQHRGLIQFGEDQAQRYGADFSSELAALNSQLGPNGAIVKYLRGSGFQNGMSGLDLYSTINAGAPGRYGASDTAAGGTWGSVADKWNHQMQGHLQNAERLLGDFSGNLGTIATDTQGAADAFGRALGPQGLSMGTPVGGDATGMAGGFAATEQQFLQQFQTILSQFLQQFQTIVQQATQTAGGGLGGGILGGGEDGAKGVATGTKGVQTQMGGFFQNISSFFQNMFSGLGDMLKGLFSNILGGLGGGGGGGILGSIFGGFFDSGGNIPRGKVGIAGEFGPEIIKGPASVVGREETMGMFRDAANSNQQVQTQVPAINNIIVQDQAVVSRYLSTSAGRRQIANIVKQTQNPAG